MMLPTVGNKWIAANFIFDKVKDNRFRCSDLDKDWPQLKCYLRDMCDSGVLIKYRQVHNGRVNEYQLAPGAIEKIQRYGQ